MFVTCDPTRITCDMSDMTHSYVWRDSFMCETWLIYMQLIHSFVRCNAHEWVTSHIWISHVAHVTGNASGVTCHAHKWVMSHMNESRHVCDSFSHLFYSFVSFICFIHLFYSFVSFIHLFHSFARHDSFMCDSFIHSWICVRLLHSYNINSQMNEWVAHKWVMSRQWMKQMNE